MLASCAKTVAAALLWVGLALPANADDSDRKAVPMLRGTISSFPAAPTVSALNARASARWAPAPLEGANSQSSEENKGDDNSDEENKSENEEDENKNTDKEEKDKHVEFELTTDVTSQGGYWVNSRTLIAPFTDLDTSGFRLATNVIKGGGRHHNGETDEINKYEFTSADFMVGYAVERENLSMKFMMGANVADYLLSVPDPTNPMQGTQVGVKFGWELDSEPVKYNMIYAKASYSTAFNTYYAQFQYGYDFNLWQ